jgi:hypothetical protein
MSATVDTTVNYACKMPNPSVPYVDISTGQQSREWFNWSIQMMARTGGLPGIGTGNVQNQATAAQSTADTAQSTATTAQGTATAAQSTANTAQSTADANTTAIAAETAARIAADALKAPLASPHFTGTALFSGGIGVWGHAAPGAQPATPVTLGDVIVLLQSYGFAA